MKKTSGNLVYSSEHGRMCPGCSRPQKECACARKQAAAPSDGVVRVARQTKGRKGKGVTVVTGLPLGADALAALARDLKKTCGSGGTVRDGVIEIQGEHRDALVAELIRRGWAARRAGG